MQEPHDSTPLHMHVREKRPTHAAVHRRATSARDPPETVRGPTPTPPSVDLNRRAVGRVAALTPSLGPTAHNHTMPARRTPHAAQPPVSPTHTFQLGPNPHHSMASHPQAHAPTPCHGQRQNKQSRRLTPHRPKQPPAQCPWRMPRAAWLPLPLPLHNRYHECPPFQTSNLSATPLPRPLPHAPPALTRPRSPSGPAALPPTAPSPPHPTLPTCSLPGPYLHPPPRPRPPQDIRQPPGKMRECRSAAQTTGEGKGRPESHPDN